MKKRIEINYMGNTYHILEDLTLSGDMTAMGAKVLQIIFERANSNYHPAHGFYDAYITYQIEKQLRGAETKILIKQRKRAPGTVY